MKSLPDDFNQDLPLDDEGKELMDIWSGVQADGGIGNELSSERLAELQAAAKNTINPPKQKISTRLAKPDLAKLRARAMEKGMPYQTLLASIVHQYVEGNLVERRP